MRPYTRLELQRPVHGSISPAELRALGLDIKDVLDFSANINPLGVSPRVKEAVAGVEIARYPDPDCLELRHALAQSTGVGMDDIVVGNGSTELIHLLARVCLAGGGSATVLTPTFGEYEMACRLAGVQPAFIRAAEEHDFQWNVADVCRRISQLQPRLVFLCNPNNPTGVYLASEDVRQIARATAPGLLALDEAYLPFVEKPWDSRAVLELGNVVLLRSMTKDHALTGLRLGYALAPAGVIEKLKLYQPSWSVNAAAQAAGVAALADHEHVSRARKLVAEAKAYLDAALRELGLKVFPASANFLLVKVGDAGSVRSGLLRRGVCVRDCTSFGLPQYIRVAVRTLPECRRLVESLKDVCRG